MIEFTGTRDHAPYPADGTPATIAGMYTNRSALTIPTREQLEIGNHGDFWSQVPVVLFTVAVVVAIVVVNTRIQAAPLPVALPPAIEVDLAPVGCLDCGEVIAVRAAPNDEVGAPERAQGGVVLDVRMTDGSVRTVKQFAPGFNVGDRVQVNGNALIARG